MAVPGLHLLLPLDCACGGGARGGGGPIRGRFVGECRLIREGRASAPGRQGGLWVSCHRGRFSVVPSKADSRSCHQGRFSVVPSRRVPSKRVPSRRVPSKRVPSKCVPSKRVPSKRVPS